MSKLTLYNKTDIFLGNVTFVHFSIDDIFGDNPTDGYTELARSKIKQLKFETDYTLKESKRDYLNVINEQVREQALLFIQDKEQLQFWCDLAEWDYDKVKKWLLNTKKKDKRWKAKSQMLKC